MLKYNYDIYIKSVETKYIKLDTFVFSWPVTCYMCGNLSFTSDMNQSINSKLMK